MNTIQVSRFEELEGIIEQGLRTFIDVGRCFVEIKESGLYKEKYKTFEAYCYQRWGFSLNYAEKLMRTVRTEEVLKSSTTVPSRTLPANERQYRELDGLSDQDKKDTWDAAVESAPGGVVTAAHIRATRELSFPRDNSAEGIPQGDQKGDPIKCPACGHEWFIDS
jgi:hypothetical protein